MALTSKRLMLSGRKFLALRMECALGGGDIHTDDESPRAQTLSLLIGAVVTAAAVGLCAAFTAWRPAEDLGEARILLADGTGALYVRVEDVVHPVLNLTSARLVTGTVDNPVVVSADALSEVKRGALLGIPGAPPVIGAPLETEPAWTVCDDGSTTVIGGAPLTSPVDAVLAMAPSGQVYLLYDGQRARIDLTDRAVVQALHLDSVQPARVSATLLSLLPEVAPVATPRIPDIGAHGPSALPGFRIGDVIGVRNATQDEFFVVLAAGVQPLSPVAADIIRHTSPSAAVTMVAPAALVGLPDVGVLRIGHFPRQVLRVRGADTGVCATWYRGAVDVRCGPVPLEGFPVRLAGADGDGPHLDQMNLPAGRYAYVRTHSGDTAGWLVTELGVRFRVDDADTARVLGLPEPVLAPAAVLDALARGPVLSRSAALLAHDTITSP